MLDFHIYYCYNQRCMTAKMCEVADTLGRVVMTVLSIREFERSQSILDIGERRTCYMSKTKVRINLKAFDNKSLDLAAGKIVDTVKRLGGSVVGPVPLPTEIERVTVLRAVHKYKDSREQFEMRTHKRLIEIVGPTAETIDSLSRLELPSGVDIEIKL